MKKATVTNNADMVDGKSEAPPPLKQLIDRIASGVSIQGIERDVVRMIGELAAGGFWAHEIKKQLNGCSFPTLSGKLKWTVAEVRQLVRRT